MNAFSIIKKIFLAVLFVVFGSSMAQAVPINYGDLNGVNFVYEQVTEDSSTDPPPLYGTPSISGDSLLFSSTSFGASAVNGAIDLTDGTLKTTIQSISTTGIEQLQLSEKGDYSLIGTGTRSTSVSVAAPLFVRITQLDGSPIAPITGTFNMMFSPSDGTYNRIDDPGIAVNWTGDILVDIDAMIAAANLTGKATSIDITLDNSLIAFSETGTIASIEKAVDGLSITPITPISQVPEPSTMLLLGSGLIGLAGYGRKKFF